MTEARHEMFGVDLPELPATESLHEVWHELGRAGKRGAFDWLEILAYVELTGTALAPVECRTLVSMSEAYVAGMADVDRHSKAPLARFEDG